MSEPQNDPIEPLLNLFVYAPLGALSIGAENFPQLVAKGKQRAAGAKMVGKFAMAAGSKKANDRFEQAFAHLNEFVRIVSESANAKMTPSKTDVEVVIDVDEAPVITKTKKSTTTPKSTKTSSDEIASIAKIFPGYDEMTAAEICGSLDQFSKKQLEKIVAYEKANRNRSTVLHKAARLLKPSN